MDIKTFWHQYDAADKKFKKWETRADQVIQRYRDETKAGEPNLEQSFNILHANTAVLMPSLFSAIPKPDIQRRYKDDDPDAKQGGDVLSRALEFIMDDGDFYAFGVESVRDYLLPGMTIPKVRYVPLISAVRKEEDLTRGWEDTATDPELHYYRENGDRVDPAEVQFDEQRAFYSFNVEEVVDEHVVIERWPWKNFRHQVAKRWKDVRWIDFISFLDEKELKRRFKGKAADIKLTVDATGDSGERDSEFKATHAEIHEVWFMGDRKVRTAVRDGKKWLEERGDPLKLKDFWPTPKPLMAIDTNDSMQPIPPFVLYQDQADELDKITRRISKLIGALKLVGIYAGSEKALLQQVFESDENRMIPVPDWHTIKDSGGLRGLVEWLPIEEVGKVLTALFREREQIVAQIFELTGIADIQRGSTDPRETKGSQVIKAQFANRRTLTPRQDVERFFRDVLRIAAEILAEHFEIDTLQRMTGLEIEKPVEKLLRTQLERQYRIDIETDSTVAPDEEREQANMAKALQAVTQFITGMAPLIQQGMPLKIVIQLLKVYLRKFRWGKDIEEALEALERNPPKPAPDPEMMKMQAEMHRDQQQFQQDQQAAQAELQRDQQKFVIEIRGMLQKLALDQRQGQQELVQDQAAHDQEMVQDAEKHDQELRQKREIEAATSTDE